MNSKTGKTESHNLYSYTHLSGAKINLKMNESPGQFTKLLKYCSKPNPVIHIKSSTERTTVFLPSSPRSILKSSNDLYENNFTGFDCSNIQTDFPSSKVVLSSNPNDAKKHEMLFNKTFAKNRFNCKSNNRYLPNILKTKKSKNGVHSIQSNTENKSVGDAGHRKRKQVYDLSSVTDEDLDQNSAPPSQKKRKKKQEIVQKEKLETEVSKIEKRKIEAIEGKIKKEEDENEDGPLRKRPKLERKAKANNQKEKNIVKKKIENSCARVCLFEPKKSAKTSEIKFCSTNLNKEEKFVNSTSENESFLSDAENDLSSSETRDESDIQQGNQEVSEEPEQIQDFEETEKSNEEISEEFSSVEESTTEFPEDSPAKETSIEALLGFEDFKGFESEMKNFEELYYKKKHPFPLNGEFLIPDYLNHIHPYDLIEFLDDSHKLLNLSLFDDFTKIAPIDEVEHRNDSSGDNLKIQNLLLHDFDENFYFNLPSKTSHLGPRNSLINGYGSEEFDSDIADECCRKESDYFDDAKQINKYEERENIKNDILPDSPKSLQSIEESGKNPEINIDRFKCHECDITFGKQRSLDIHLSKNQIVHSFACKFCMAPFKTKAQLQWHYKNCFRDIRKTLTCLICDKKYSYQSSLTQHMKKHFYP